MLIFSASSGMSVLAAAGRYFSEPPRGIPPADARQLRSGKARLLRHDQGLLIHGGTGRFGWCFAQWAKRAASEGGHEDRAIFAVPGSVQGWWLASQGQSPHLPTIDNINPDGRIVFLPPRDVVSQLDSERDRCQREASVWSPAFEWARRQLDTNPDLADVTRDMARSAEFQVVSTKLGTMGNVMTDSFIDGLPRGAVLLHATKSVAPGGRFGAEVGWEAFRSRGRDDLARRWISSEGYATEHELGRNAEVRLRFTALAETALVKALEIFLHKKLKISMGVGKKEVLAGQWINAGKNVAALGTGYKAARLAFATPDRADYVTLGTEFEEYRTALWEGLRQLAGKDLETDDAQFSKEGRDDFFNCTTVSWSELFDLPVIRDAFALAAQDGPVTLDDIRKRMIAFRGMADPRFFGTTNSTFGMIYAVARMMRVKRRLNHHVIALLSGQPIPEGIPALKNLLARPSLHNQKIPWPLGRLVRDFKPICDTFAA